MPTLCATHNLYGSSSFSVNVENASIDVKRSEWECLHGTVCQRPRCETRLVLHTLVKNETQPTSQWEPIDSPGPCWVKLPQNSLLIDFKVFVNTREPMSLSSAYCSSGNLWLWNQAAEWRNVWVQVHCLSLDGAQLRIGSLQHHCVAPARVSPPHLPSPDWTSLCFFFSRLKLSHLYFKYFYLISIYFHIIKFCLSQFRCIKFTTAN